MNGFLRFLISNKKNHYLELSWSLPLVSKFRKYRFIANRAINVSPVIDYWLSLIRLVIVIHFFFIARPAIFSYRGLTFHMALAFILYIFHGQYILWCLYLRIFQQCRFIVIENQSLYWLYTLLHKTRIFAFYLSLKWLLNLQLCKKWRS